MCGIAGCLTADAPADRRDVEAMLATVAHRGPDASGVFASGRAAVGQNRLSIIDLETGDPPITTADGSIGVAFNGEIYAYRELRRRLAEEGHELRTAGDTEVVVHLAEDLEPVELARRLTGMYALAVWDARRERLVLVRDRLGKKPLYYWTNGRDVAFGSEIKAVLRHPDVPRRLDPGAIPAYLTFGYVPTPRTFYEGVRSLPPGHVLVADAEGVRVLEYWRPPVAGVNGVDRLALSGEEAARTCRQLLGDAVERRLVADVPVGAFLSGGIDSSTVVALMSERMSQPVRTFTIGFDDDHGYDERRWADLVATRFATEHQEFVVKPDDVDLVERLLWHFDQPFADSSALPTYLLSELTAGEVTVALSGDGGDEVFAGYERLAAATLVPAFRAVPAPLRRALASGARSDRLRLAAKVGRFAERASTGLPGALRSWISYVPDEIASQLLLEPDTWAIDDYESVWRRSEGAATLQRVLHLNLSTYLLDDLLPKVDRTSMAHGLEVRSPFLDPEVVSFGLRLPSRHLVRGTTLKWVLKQAMRGTVPDEILDRGKRGFGVPLARWFRADLGAHLADRLGPTSPVRTHLRSEAVGELLAEHAAGVRDHAAVLWSLLVLDAFLRREGW